MNFKINEAKEDNELFFHVWVGNLGKYNEGELVGEWVEFPCTEEEWEETLRNIGIGSTDDFGAPYEEYFIGDYNTNIPDIEGDLGEYPSFEQLCEVGDVIEKSKSMDALAIKNAFEVCNDPKEVIEKIEDGSLTFIPDVDNDEDLGHYIVDTYYNGVEELDSNTINSYIDYEDLGRDLSFEDYEGQSAGEYWCGDENAANFDIGEAYIDEVGVDGITNPESYFDFESFGRDARLEGNFSFTADGCVEITD